MYQAQQEYGISRHLTSMFIIRFEKERRERVLKEMTKREENIIYLLISVLVNGNFTYSVSYCSSSPNNCGPNSANVAGCQVDISNNVITNNSLGVNSSITVTEVDGMFLVFIAQLMK